MHFYVTIGDDPTTEDGCDETRLFRHLRIASERNFDLVDLRDEPSYRVRGGGYEKRYRHMPELLRTETRSLPLMLLADGLRLNPRDGFILSFPYHLNAGGLMANHV
jgi:hypothetical protein